MEPRDGLAQGAYLREVQRAGGRAEQTARADLDHHGGRARRRGGKRYGASDEASESILKRGVGVRKGEGWDDVDRGRSGPSPSPPSPRSRTPEMAATRSEPSPARARRPWRRATRACGERRRKSQTTTRFLIELRTRPGEQHYASGSLTVNTRVCECDSSECSQPAAPFSTSPKRGRERPSQSVVLDVQATAAGVSNGDIARVPERHLLLPPEWPRGTVVHFPSAPLGDSNCSGTGVPPRRHPDPSGGTHDVHLGRLGGEQFGAEGFPDRENLAPVHLVDAITVGTVPRHCT